jgi:hypothetical protein
MSAPDAGADKRVADEGRLAMLVFSTLDAACAPEPAERRPFLLALPVLVALNAQLPMLLACVSSLWAIGVTFAYGQAASGHRVTRKALATILVDTALHAAMQSHVTTDQTERHTVRIDDALETKSGLRVAVQRREPAVHVVAARSRQWRQARVQGR